MSPNAQVSHKPYATALGQTFTPPLPLHPRRDQSIGPPGYQETTLVAALWQQNQELTNQIAILFQRHQRIRELQQTERILRQDLGIFCGRVTVLSKEKNDCLEELKQLKGEFDKIREAFRGLEIQHAEQRATLSGQIDTLTQEKTQSVEDANRASRCIQEKEGEIRTLTAQKTQLEAQVEGLRGKVSVLTSEKEAANAALTAQKTQLEAKIARLTGKVSTLTREKEAANAAFTAQKTQLEAQVARLTGKVSTLTYEKEAANAAFTAQKTQLEAQVAKLTGKVSTLTYEKEAANAALTAQKTQLEAKIAKLTETVDLLNQENALAVALAQEQAATNHPLAAHLATLLLDIVKAQNNRWILDLAIPSQLRLSDADLSKVSISNHSTNDIAQDLLQRYWKLFIEYAIKKEAKIPPAWTVFILRISKTLNPISPRNNTHINRIMTAFFANAEITAPDPSEYTQLLIDHPHLTCSLWQQFLVTDLFDIWQNDHPKFARIIVSSVLQEEDGACAPQWSVLKIFDRSVTSTNPNAMHLFLHSLEANPQKKLKFEADLLKHPALLTQWKQLTKKTYTNGK